MNNKLLNKFIQLKEPDILGSYASNDAIFLLKDISNLITEQGNEEREKAIQTGIHYSEMLPIEYQPTQEYLDVFYKTLEDSAIDIANAVAAVSNKIIEKRGRNIVLVSLARAGTPIGILIKRYIKFKYNVDLKHYSISIIRDKGIDENAVMWILKNHPNEEMQFVDGWTGKGVINKVLSEACAKFLNEYEVKINPELAVIADPAYCVDTFGTREDILIPSACLNATVSGLISRTVCRNDIIKENDFHGVKYYIEWEKDDLSNFFIDKISSNFENVIMENESNSNIHVDVIKDLTIIQEKFDIDNINFIKPGIGETTRVLLRRVPWKILVKNIDDPKLKHIIILAKDRGVPVEIYEKMSYSVCGIIKSKNKKDLE